MGRIKMLNLFRCSSVGEKMIEKDIHYFVTDYFDGIKVENLSSESTMLAECMGIKRAANKNKEGISHQRYCLYSEYETEGDIFEISQTYPLLTVIQVFINPDIYQADCFTENEKEISCKNCMDKVEECIRRNFQNNREVHWKIYRLLTAGDFAVIVRSKRIHAAYDISTLIRGICIMPEGNVNREAALFTYSISGVLDKRMDSQDVYNNIDWTEYLDEKDRIIVRIVYDQADDEGNMISEDLLPLGYRLLGRYDYQIECSPSEFQEMYSYIRNYKFGGKDMGQEALEGISNPKAKELSAMIKMGHVLRINEKIFLYYDKDPFLTNESIDVWKLSTKGKWISLYENNEKIITRMKELANQIEERLDPFYQSERNLKEYARLLGRFCRVLHEINQMRELRISTANLSRQLNIMLHSLMDYLENAEKYHWDNQTAANRISEYLHIGMNNLEIFARYIRNINLQTLQTPNYDLQTNMCIEKILLAYSQFLRPFLVKQKNCDCYGTPYYFSGTLYPIVVPNMGVKDLSVCVLFDDYHLEEKDSKGKRTEKLMVVSNPTFSYLCETCFLLPAMFHEIAHQFRYESHEKRNRCLEAYLMKGFLFNVLMELIDEENEYGFGLEEEFDKVVDAVYKSVEGKMVSDEILGRGLQIFKFVFRRSVQELIAVVQEQITPRSVIESYIKKTKGDVRRYHVDILSVLEGLSKGLEELETRAGKKSAYDKEVLSQILDDFKDFFRLQEKQIFDEIVGIIHKAAKDRKQVYGESDNLVNELEKFCNVSWEDKDTETKGKETFALWKDLEEEITDFIMREDLKSLLKHYHNLHNAYWEAVEKWKKIGIEIQYQNKNWNLETLSRKIRYQNIFNDMSAVMYENLLEMLNEFGISRNRELEWEAIPLNGERLEQLKRRVKFEKEEGLKKRLKGIFSRYQEGRIEEFIDNQIETYREITSDLFMCSMMGLNIFGYLVVVAENYVFNRANECALYKRISIVLQCLCKRREEMKLDAEKFSEELLETLCSELNILRNECRDVFIREDSWDASKVELEEIVEFLEGLRQMTGKTTTQDWILRIFQQISYIIFNIKGTCVACDEIGEKEIWKDLVSEESYIERKETMQEVLCNHGGEKLCGCIAQILNSPASYFMSKRYLLTEEIEFILSHYEKNCRQIFE